MAENRIEKLLSNFQFEQYMLRTIVELLQDYPSLQEGLEKAREKGIKKIEMGGTIPFISKPTLVPDSKLQKITIHFNNY